MRRFRSVDIAKEKRNIQSYFSNNPRKCNLMLDAIGNFQAVMQKSHIEEGDLDSIRAAVMENDGQVWAWAGTWLQKLAEVFDGVKNLYCELAEHKSWVVRRNICALLVGTPYELVAKLLPKLLEDRSTNVRIRAVSTALWTRRKNLIPLLEGRVHVEANKRILDRLEFVIAILSTGKVVKNGLVWTLTKHGLHLQ
jgi:hypothetical protein